MAEDARPVAVGIGVLGDLEPLWHAWLDDAARRARVDLDPSRLDEQLPNWRALLERFAEDHAPVYLRPSAPVTAALRRLRRDGVPVGVVTEYPDELTEVALSHLGATGRVATHGTLAHVRDVLGDVRLVQTVDGLRDA